MHALSAAIDAPDWVLAQMPSGYQNRVAEIRRLSAELEDMGRFGRLLWSIGPDLREAVLDLFGALRFQAELLEGNGGSSIAVRFDAQRRLLLHIAGTEATIDKQSSEVAHVFGMIHQMATDYDRVALVANCDRMHQPSDRPDSVAPDALRLLQRMGANVVAAPTLFKVWVAAGHDVEQARRLIGRLHEQDGGTFTLPA
jgi:hypothetical protein